jgi:hypothetical protein
MKIKGWRTILFSVAVALTGLAELTDAINLIAPEYNGLLLLAIGIGSALLRYLTNTPIGKDDTQ